MRLYLVRHSDALTATENPDRPLSKLGIEKVEAIGTALSKHPFPLTAIFHSGKERAKETAIKLGTALHPNLVPVKNESLLPNNNPQDILDFIANQKHNTMLVGHLPLIEKVANILLTGNEIQVGFQFHSCSILCLELIDNRWKLAWFLDPEIFL